ncbi:MAG: hypothetical protein ACO3JL_04485 [Myxococcota bacterium]
MAFTRQRVRNTLEPSRVRTDGTVAEPSEDRLRAKVQQNSAYEKYKQSLHAFFDGNKPLPDHLRALLATKPGAEGHLEEGAVEATAAETTAASAKKPPRRKNGPTRDTEEEKRPRRVVKSGGDDYRGLLDAVRRASSPREVEAAIDALRGAGFALPSDGEVLSKALGHTDEAVICDALRGLLDVSAAGGIKSPRLLRTRVENVALLATTAECRELCGTLKGKLL